MFCWADLLITVLNVVCTLKSFLGFRFFIIKSRNFSLPQKYSRIKNDFRDYKIRM